MVFKFLSFLLLLNTGYAQTVQITEIAPHTLAEKAEWFEFSVTHDQQVDMNEWSVARDTGSSKKFSENKDKIIPGQGVETTDDPLVFTINETGFFSLQPSLVSLPNDGGTIKIITPQGPLAQTSYPKAKSSSTKNYEQREVWNWSEAFLQLVPQLIRAAGQAPYQHTQGAKNVQLPTPASQYQAVISEFSPDNSVYDFVEIFIKDGPEKINLQYVTLKHNGTVLWHFESAFFVEPGDYLVFNVGAQNHQKISNGVFNSNTKTGLSAGSGTLELIAMTNTSLEQALDTVCWKNQTLSQTEQNRVDKFLADQRWNGSCVEISTLIKNESLARNLAFDDTNQNTDFKRHFNGSVGVLNEVKNQPPTAVINIQGSGKSVSSINFFLNVDGQSSSDPDGFEDIKTYEWKFKDQVISNKANPAGFYVENIGEFELSLTVTDYSGAQHTVSRLIVGLAPNRSVSLSGSDRAKKAVAEQLITDSLKRAEKKDQNSVVDDFFTPFLNRPDWTEIILKEAEPHPLYPDYKVFVLPTKKPAVYQSNWPRKINLPNKVRHRLKKNLGVLFSWRESPWPDLEAEWSAVLANDQKSAYFSTVYLGF